MTGTRGIDPIVYTLPFAVAGALVVLLGLAAPAPVAAQQCVATQTFPVGQQTPFVVPPGVTTISVDAYGAQGGSTTAGVNGGAGGRGARATLASLPVTPGETLTMIVGGQGESMPNASTTPRPGGFGGPVNGGTGGASIPSAAHAGGGGGGATAILRGSTRLLVAGGGGGGSHGGRGGDAGLNGNPGEKQSTPADGTGVPGGGATGATPGAGGMRSTLAGSNGADGADGSPSGQGGTGGAGGDGGGGGGGGYAGGGGGGGGTAVGPGGSVGGGGGSSFGPPGTAFVTGARTGDGSLTIEFRDPGCQPAIALVKSRQGTGPVAVGSTVTYNFLVTNTGTTGLSNVMVADPLPGLSPVACPGTALAAGASMTCTATYTVTAADRTNGNINNIASVTGQPPAGFPPVTATDNETVPVEPAPEPAIALVKSSTRPTPVVEGSTITYSFLVTNTGNVPLTAVTVTDPLPGLSPISCPGTTLAVGANMTCTATYVVTAADVTAGAVNNSATATGTPPPGSGGPPTVIGTDNETVPIPTPVPTLPAVMLALLATLLGAAMVRRLRHA